MARITKRLMDWAIWERDPRAAGIQRTWRGFREGNDRDLYIGLALTALAYLQTTAPRKQLIYRKAVPEGSTLVIQHKRRGAPRLEIVKPEDD
jgi:hypothetical protein